MINREKYIEWAKKNGMGINKEMSEMVLEGLEMKKKQFEIAYCPCVTPYGHEKDTVCPCKEWREGYKTLGKCHCGIFIYE